MKYLVIVAVVAVCSCHSLTNISGSKLSNNEKVKLVTLDPGHFHAALVQKEMYPVIDSEVYVYAPGGPELEAHLSLIGQYNNRPDHPTHWNENVYTGADYFDKMLAEKKGNVVVLAGNNQQKTEYIKRTIDAGLNVLGDKPMAINYSNFLVLQQAFNDAAKKNLLLYDIMTERSEITNTLQKTLAGMPEVFGQLRQGSATDPSVIMESVHFYYKYVSGKVLTRPAWFFDPAQQGDAIADVGTHLIDLAQWECFPNEVIDYTKDIQILSANIWPTPITLSQFAAITNKNEFPAYLQPYVTNDTVLQTHGNGTINYMLKGVPVKVTARWEFKAPPGSGDTHYSLLKGTRANIEIKQGADENYQPTLYVIPTSQADVAAFATTLQQAIADLNRTWPGVALEKKLNGWRVIIPEVYKVGHEAHFAQVMQRYLQYLDQKKLPAWEVPNMLAKYYTATKALQMAQ